MGKDLSLTASLFGRDVSMGKALGGVGKQAKSADAAFKNLSRGATVAFAAIAGAATLAVKAAMEDQAAAVQLAQTLKNTMGATKGQTAAVEDYISKMTLATGVSDNDLRPAYQRLISSTKSYEKTQSLMSLAMDISFSKSIPLVDVTNALAKASEGNVNALKKLKISLPEVGKTQAQYSSKLGIVDGKLQMVTKQTKAATKETLSFGKLQAYLTKTFKGSTDVALATSAQKMKIFNNGMQELQETIGYALLPTVNKFLKRLPEILDYLTRNKDTIIKVGTAILALSGFIIGVNAALKVFYALQSVKMFAGLIARWMGFATVVETEAVGMAAAGTAVNIAWAPFLLTILGIAAAFAGIKLVTDKLIANREALLNKGDKNLGSDLNKLYGMTPERLAALNKPSEMKAMPRMAKGGIVTRATSLIAGEAGPEAIIPLNKMGMMGGSINIHVAGSIIAEKDFILKVRNELAQLLRRGGAPISALGI